VSSDPEIIIDRTGNFSQLIGLFIAVTVGAMWERVLRAWSYIGASQPTFMTDCCRHTFRTLACYLTQIRLETRT
jgi:hypothetical protein